VRNGVNTTPENAPVVEADELPDPVLANPDADTGEDTLPGDALTSNTDCVGDAISIVNQVRPFVRRFVLRVRSRIPVRYLHGVYFERKYE
jgi:hypothetical protein